MRPFAALMAAALLAALTAVAFLAACGGDDRPPPPPPVEPDAAITPGPEPRVETVVEGLEAPWEIAFLPNGEALVTERAGRVRLLGRDGALAEEPVAELEVEANGEAGLMGIAIDPDFGENSLVYLYLTAEDGNKVMRFRYAEGGLSDGAVLFEGVRAAAIHDGGRARFGPDGDLYVSTGDAAEPDLAQDPGSLNGKILRVPGDVARAGVRVRPEVFSLGHRNPQGFDWEPGSGRLVSDEHGPDGDDEVNLIERGANHGWPLLRGDQEREGFAAPVTHYEDSIAPSGATFVRTKGSAWTGDYLIACLIGNQIRRVRIDGDRVTVDEALFEGRFGRLRTIVEGPDGALYVLTNNTDGRGSPQEGDDRILRIVPPS